MGELLLDSDSGAGIGAGQDMAGVGGQWSVERRFRVTEVFLAVLWVCFCVLLLEIDYSLLGEWRIASGWPSGEIEDVGNIFTIGDLRKVLEQLLIRTQVLRIRLPILLFYRLPYVSLVSTPSVSALTSY